MEVRATAKYVKVQPRKVRIIADKLRGKPAEYSSALLRFHPSKSAACLNKVLMSAMANAEENHQIDKPYLRIATIMVDEGPVQKRMRARAMGRGFRILKKTSHITVVLEEYEPPVKAKTKSKAKPRPTFSAPSKKGKGKKEASAKAEAPAEVIEEPVVEAAEGPEVLAEADAVIEPEVVEEAAETPAGETPAEEEVKETSEEKPSEEGAE